MRFGMRSGLGAAAALALLCSGPAGAVDNLIPGKIHIIKPTLTKMVSKPVGAFTIPAPLSAGDPVVNGGALDVFDTADGDGFTTALPASGWKGLGNPAGSKGYKYKGAGSLADPCKVVLVKSTVIKFVCKDDQNLDPPLGGTSGINLALGADNYCAEFGGTTVKNQVDLLKRKVAPAPGACPSIATCCNSAPFHDFSTVAGSGSCGTFSSASMNNNLDCGTLYFGGGGNSVPLPSVQLPDQGSAITAIDSCVGQAAVLGEATSAQTGSNRNCTATGCLFGAPLAVPNASSIPTSTCVLNLVSANGMGTLDCATGAQTLDLPLSSIIYLTGDTATDPGATITGIQPCPLCSGGSCIGGPNNGMGCTPGTSDSSVLNDSYPTSHDCPPDPSFDIGTLPIAFSLSSGTVTWNATTSGTQARVFSGFCRDADDTGGFENPPNHCFENGMTVGGGCGGVFEACEQRTQGAFGPNGNGTSTITEIGSPQAGILGGSAAGTLVSVFSIPPTYNATVDAAADLPGPGAVALPGDGTLCADAMACP